MAALILLTPESPVTILGLHPCCYSTHVSGFVTEEIKKGICTYEVFKVGNQKIRFSDIILASFSKRAYDNYT